MAETISTSILFERMARIIQTEMHAEGLKPTQWEVIRYLARANRFSRNPTALTQYLGMTKGTVSQTIQALERKGLLVKQAIDEDRRAISLVLTQEGYELLNRDPIGQVDGALESFAEPERALLCKMMQSLLLEMLRINEGKPFGVCKNCQHFKADHKDGSPHLCSLLNEQLSCEDQEQICFEQAPMN